MEMTPEDLISAVSRSTGLEMRVMEATAMFYDRAGDWVFTYAEKSRDDLVKRIQNLLAVNS
jgi:hypothetical protein